MRKPLAFSSLEIGLHLSRIHPLVLGLFAALAILTSCGGGVSGGGGLTVVLSYPVSTVYTHGTVTIQVAVSGGTPDDVQLLKDGTLLVSLAPPYQFDWDTASTPEGSYELVARATKSRQSFTSEPRTVVVDRTAPAIASRVPSPNATNTFVDDPIVVGFTKPLLPTSVGPGSFALRSGATPIPITPLLSSDGKTVTLERHVNLTVPATLTLTVDSSITDLAGNALVRADAWSWSVPEWGVVGGAVNAISAQDAYYPALALDASGKPIVAFHAVNRLQTDVYVQRWTGSTWQAVGGAINAVVAQHAYQPALALDGTGEPVVALYESDASFHWNVYVQQWMGSEWHPLGGAVNAVPGRDTSAPVLALDGSGKPVIAFSESDGNHSYVYVRQWTGSTWQSVGGPVNAMPAGDTSAPVLALDGSGKPVIAFYEFDGNHNNVYVRHWTGSDWQAVGGAINAVIGRDTFQPALAVDASGKPIVAFQEYDTRWNIYVEQWTGTAWQAVGGAINGVMGRDTFQPALAVDASGKPVVAFVESDGSHRNVYVQRWNGRDWQSAGTALNAVRGQDAYPPAALVLNGNGKPAVSFIESDGTHFNVYVLRSNQ